MEAGVLCDLGFLLWELRVHGFRDSIGLRASTNPQFPNWGFKWPTRKQNIISAFYFSKSLAILLPQNFAQEILLFFVPTKKPEYYIDHFWSISVNLPDDLDVYTVIKNTLLIQECIVFSVSVGIGAFVFNKFPGSLAHGDFLGEVVDIGGEVAVPVDHVTKTCSEFWRYSMSLHVTGKSSAKKHR